MYRNEADWLEMHRRYAKADGHRGALRKKLYRAKREGEREQIIELAESLIGLCTSERRCDEMFRCLYDQPADIFWPLWLSSWSMVDQSSQWHELMPHLFKTKGSALRYYEAEARAFYDRLPDTITVYRGCDSRFVHGLCWTTDIERAKYFATGGRYGPPRDPVILTGIIKKRSRKLFYVDPSRGESEIVCTPGIEDIITFDAEAHFLKMIGKASAPELAAKGEGNGHQSGTDVLHAGIHQQT
jgi:hypothetical protein